MKSTVTKSSLPSNEFKPNTLYRSKKSELVVLSSSPEKWRPHVFSGTVIITDKYHTKVGLYLDCWDRDSFELFSGTIELEQ